MILCVFDLKIKPLLKERIKSKIPPNFKIIIRNKATVVNSYSLDEKRNNMKYKILLSISAAIFSYTTYAQQTTCHIDSNSTDIQLTSYSELHDYNGQRIANFSGISDFSNSTSYTSYSEANYNFTSSFNVGKLCFSIEYIVNNNNSLPADNFINIQIGANPLIVTTTDSLSFYLSSLGYNTSVSSSTSGGWTSEFICIENGPVFTSFSIGIGIETFLSDVCVTGATLSKIEESKDQLNVFPNPSTGLIYLEGIQGSQNVLVTDLTGKTVFNGTIDNNTINLSNVTSGVYILQADKQTKKIIIE